MAPAIDDLTGRRVQAGAQVGDYHTGVWAPGESRDYHIGLRISPAPPGSRVTACLVSVTIPGPGNATYERPSKPILAQWLE